MKKYSFLLKTYTISSLFSILLSVSGNAQQNYFFQHLTAKDGLASEEVTGVLHDSHGYIWIGTNKGLQKYDGNNFTVIPYGEDIVDLQLSLQTYLLVK